MSPLPPALARTEAARMGACRLRAAVLPAVVSLLLAGCAQQAPVAEDAGGSAGTWTTLPSAPLAPRLDAVTAWTGAEALFLGGDVDDLCPPDAGCAGPPESAADGAAYDPVGQAWRPVADAPHPIPGGTPSTVAGDTVHLVRGDRLLSYDASEDAWSVSPPAPAGTSLGAPAALGDGTVVVARSERRAGDPADRVYDPGTRTWSELPDDPLGPTFDRVVTALPGGLVLTGVVMPEDPGTDRATVTAAVLDLAAGTWTPLGDSGRAGGWRWSWTGERMIDVHPDGQSADGDRFPQGGALDPRTGDWNPLPGAPLMNSGGWPVDALGGPVAAVDGWVYDDRDRTWTLLDRPDGAPADPGAAVWAGHELIVLGGMDSDAGWGSRHLSDGAWSWRAAAGGADAPSPDTDELIGARWVLQSEVVDGETREPTGVRDPTLSFRADGTVDVDTGCVEGTTAWHVRGDTVGIEEFGWYGLSCSDAEFDRQRPMLDTWSAFRPTVEADVLTLVPVDADAPTLVYRAG